MLFDEKKINLALARVCASKGGITLGTAFFISTSGIAYTCHHLVENLDEVILSCADGRELIGLIGVNNRFPEIDLVIIHCQIDFSTVALPIVADRKNVTHF